MSELFRALVLRNAGDRGYRAGFEDLTVEDLPEGDVLVDVEYSDLNYKDGLAVTGRGRIVRDLPLVPGVDLAGRVVTSKSDLYRPGDAIVSTGWHVGEKYWGGYAQKARLRSEWLVPLPEGLDARQAMAVGTAGFTAMQCVLALEDGAARPDGGPVVVTGAAGGVGSVAVAILAGLGYEVHAVTGRAETHAYLRDLGASALLTRDQMTAAPRALESARWAGAVDAVGGVMLARVLAECREGATVAACGLAGGHDLPTTVMPFILRGVRLQGINSVTVSLAQRRKI